MANEWSLLWVINFDAGRPETLLRHNARLRADTLRLVIGHLSDASRLPAVFRNHLVQAGFCVLGAEVQLTFVEHLIGLLQRSRLLRL